MGFVELGRCFFFFLYEMSELVHGKVVRKLTEEFRCSVVAR